MYLYFVFCIHSFVWKNLTGKVEPAVHNKGVEEEEGAHIKCKNVPMDNERNSYVLLATVFISQLFYLHRSATLCSSCSNICDVSFVSCKTCTICNPDWLSHTQCNWPLGGEILLLANTWQPKFFFSLPFSVFSWGFVLRTKSCQNLNKSPDPVMF